MTRQLLGHYLGLVATLGFLAQHIGEEKDLQHQKDHKKLDEDDRPQRPSHGHLAETIGVKLVDLAYQQLARHID